MQYTFYLTECSSVIDLLFLLDTSGSTKHEYFVNHIKPFIKNIVDNMNIANDETRIAVLTWGDKPYPQFYLDDYTTKEDVKFAIEELPFSNGRTNTADALKVGRDTMFVAPKGDRSDAKNLIIVVSDGVSNINSQNTLIEAVKCKISGIHMITVPVGPANKETMAMASEPENKNMFMIDNYKIINRITDAVIAATCDSK